jgi:hypothetical protein
MNIKTICQLGSHSVYLASNRKRAVYIIEEWHAGRRVSLQSLEAKDTLGSDLEDGKLKAFAEEAFQFDTPIFKKMD